MSETPPKPDGTDPRIVTPTDDDETVKIAHGYSTGKTYHTTRCPTVKRMQDPQEVPKSVAEWKDYTKCKRCTTAETGDGYPHPGTTEGTTPAKLLQGVTPVGCLQIRAVCVAGASRPEAAELCDVGASTVGRHALGKCNCDHGAHTLTHNGTEYVTTDEGGVTTLLSGVTPIPPDICAWLRRAIVREGVVAAPLGEVFGISEAAVRHHTRGRCEHECDAPPATYDTHAQEWVVADE